MDEKLRKTQAKFNCTNAEPFNFILKLRIELFLYSFFSLFDKKSIFSCDYLSFCTVHPSSFQSNSSEREKRETNFVFRRMIFFGHKKS